MLHVTVSSLSVVLIAAAGAGELTVEQVLPERTAAALSITGMDALVERLTETGVLEAVMGEVEGDPREHVVDLFPDGVQRPVREVIGDRDAADLLSGVSIGGGVWPMDEPKGELPLEWVAWVEFGASAQSMGPVIDEQFESLRRERDAQTVRILDVDVDMFDENGLPVLTVHREGALLVASSQMAMERMLTVQAGDSVDGVPLGESETWMAAADLMGGTSGIRCIVMPEVILDIAQMSPSAAMVGMVRPVVNTVLGLHEAFALRLDAGRSDVVLEVSGGSVMPEGVDGLFSLIHNSSSMGDGPRQFMDSSTVALTEMSLDLAGLTDLIDRLLSESPLLFAARQPFDQMRPMLEGLTRPLGKSLTQIVSVDHPITADSLRSLMVIDVKDQQALEEAFAEHLTATGFKVREFQGHQIWSTQMPSMGPGMPGGSMSLVVAGGWLLMGDDRAVESGLRRLTSPGSRPDWIPTSQPAGTDMFHKPAMAGIVDLHGSFATMLEIDELQSARIRAAIQAEDPELWEELAGDFAAENDSALQKAKALGSVLGLLLWSVERTDTGFGFRGAVTANTAS